MPPASAPPPLPAALAYAAPAVESAIYQVADTTTVRMDAGPLGPVEVVTAYAAAVAVRLGTGAGEMEPVPDVEAELRYVWFRGSFNREPYAPQRVDETAIQGAFVVRLDPRGRLELEQVPELAPELLDVTGPESLARVLFVHLPARSVEAGDVWVDTVTTSEATAERRIRTTSVVTTTLAGDTLVEGRAHLLLRTRAENRIEVDGRSGGVAVRQRMAGVIEGVAVWDPRSQLLVDRWEDGGLDGTLEIEGSAAIPVAARVRRQVTLESQSGQ